MSIKNILKEFDENFNSRFNPHGFEEKTHAYMDVEKIKSLLISSIKSALMECRPKEKEDAELKLWPSEYHKEIGYNAALADYDLAVKQYLEE